MCHRLSNRTFGYRAKLTALLGLGLALPSAHAQPISEATRDLHRQWETLQVQYFRDSVEKKAAEKLSGPTQGVTAYMAATQETPCSQHSATISNELNVRLRGRFKSSDGLCALSLGQIEPGPYSISVQITEAQTAHASSTNTMVTIRPDTRELLIELGEPDKRQEIIAQAWPGLIEPPWWRRAVGWIPGISPAQKAVDESLHKRPQWQWAEKSCGNKERNPQVNPQANHHAMLTLFALLQPIAPTSYTPRQMQTMTECAVAWDWPLTAQLFLNHWRELEEEKTSAWLNAALNLAKLQYKTGEYKTVAYDFDFDAYRGQQRIQAVHLRSMALLALDEDEKAINVLNSGAHLATQADTAKLEESGMPSLFMRYNLATALMRAGHNDEGLAVLDALGQHPSNSTLSAALIDRANLALGWQLLKLGKSRTATSVFRRITLNGPFARRAAHGLAWSWALERGERQKRVGTPVPDRVPGQSVAILRGLYQTGQINCDEFREAISDEAACSRRAHIEQAKPRDKVQRNKTASHVWQYLLETQVADLIDVESSIGLADMLRERGDHRSAARISGKAIESAKQQLSGLKQWHDESLDGYDLSSALVPSELYLWWLGEDPTLLRTMLQTLNKQSETFGESTSMHWQQVRDDIQDQIGRLFSMEIGKHEAQLQTYLNDAYSISISALDQ